jgi:predicted metalloprotease
MRWQGREQSGNVEDRRRMSGRGVAVGGGLGTLLLVLVLSFVFGIDPQQLLQPGGPVDVGGPGALPGADVQGTGVDDEVKQFVSVVLRDTEKVWDEQFRAQGMAYEPAGLVLFSGQVRSGCGLASAGMGPFYCPADQKVYLDTAFFNELEQRFQAPGDFARAYVIAHEVAHHVQHLLGITDKVHGARRQLSEVEYNDLSVRLELQADFLAGVWAHHAEKNWRILEPGDIKEALDAAQAIGDDALQMEGQGYVVPDSFTHGTSEQRVRWFTLGLKSGDMDQGDTFNAREL